MEIQKRVYGTYGVRVDSIGEFKPPVYDDNANASLNILKGVEQNNYQGVVGLTDMAISHYYWGIYPLEIYGSADSNVCVVSDHLMRTDKCKASTVNKRIANVVAHEVGHIYGLDHCKNKKCLMFDHDQLDEMKLCWRCKIALNKIKNKP